jgi:uncharacterized protein YraI
MLLQFSAVKKIAKVITVTSFVVLAGGYTTLQAEPNYEPISDDGIVPFFEVISVKTDDVLNIRKSPDPSSNKVGKIPANQTCVASLNKKSGQWVEVTHKGALGWANLRYLSRQDRGCGTYYLVTNVRSYLNMRQFPRYLDENGDKTKKVGRILATEQNCIIGLDKVTKGGIKWVMLQYNGVNGWVNSHYVREIKIDTDDYEDYCDV